MLCIAGRMAIFMQQASAAGGTAVPYRQNRMVVLAGAKSIQNSYPAQPHTAHLQKISDSHCTEGLTTLDAQVEWHMEARTAALAPNLKTRRTPWQPMLYMAVHAYATWFGE